MGNTAAPWKQLGINMLGTLAIFVWSAVLSIALFGTLKWFKLLRIDKETEFRGCDLVKHGEHAYPADAWAELQYNTNKTSVMGPMMTGTDQSKKSFNDAMEMVPTVGGLFQSVSNNFDHFDGNSRQQNSNDIELGNGHTTKNGIDNKAAVVD